MIKDNYIDADRVTPNLSRNDQLCYDDDDTQEMPLMIQEPTSEG